MKSIIQIDDHQIHIDDEHYTLFIRFKLKPETKLSEETIAIPKDALTAIGIKPFTALEKNKSNIEHWLKGQKAFTGMKKCPVCKNEFKAKGNAQVFCSKECKDSNHTPESKPITEPPKVLKERKIKKPSAAIRDKREQQAAKKLKHALQQSPNTDNLTPVRIDDKTTIYVEPGEDVEKAKKNFIKKHNQFENDN